MLTCRRYSLHLSSPEGFFYVVTTLKKEVECLFVVPGVAAGRDGLHTLQTLLVLFVQVV